MRKFALPALVAALLAAVPAAQAAVYTLSWTGNNSYAMTGSFAFDDALLGTGRINSSVLTAFSINGYQGATAIGSFDLFADGPLVPPDTFNFNFDTTTETFYVGDLSFGLNGQDWGVGAGGTPCNTTGFGFSSGSGSQGLCVGGNWVGASAISVGASTLTASRGTSVPVPVPGTLALAGLALLGVALGRSRR